jgi:hypothetical protein
MADRYVIKWGNENEHIVPNLYMGGSRALNIVIQYVNELRTGGVTGPVCVEHQESLDGSSWQVWRSTVHDGTWAEWATADSPVRADED